MKKFKVVDLESLPKGARFYFVGDARKKVYEIMSEKPDASFNVKISRVGNNYYFPYQNKIESEKIYQPGAIGAIALRPKIKVVFLSLPQDRKKQ